MILRTVLEGKNISLRTIELSDCTQNYLDWLNDTEVNQYLETRLYEQSLNSIADFVKSMRESSTCYLFAIIYENKHVGNIKIGPINSFHKFADISYFIGDKTSWGKGVATEAIRLVCEFAFKILKLNKLCAGAYEANKGSQIVLEKNGFKREGIKRKQYLTGNSEDFPGKYTDIYEYGLLSEEYKG